MNFLFTCGGTAGHINPALAVAGYISAALPDSKFLFIGAEGRMEVDLVPRAGYDIRTVKVTSVCRGLSFESIARNLKTCKNVVGAIKESRKIIEEFRPDVVAGTGGYVCYPVIRAAKKLGIPTAVHESNAVPGLTTKMLEGCADVIMVGFDEARKNYKYPDKVKVTGTPVRSGFFADSKSEARKAMGLGDVRPLVASVCGSLGASHMNEILSDFIARACLDDTFDIIHSAGRSDYERMSEMLDKKCPDYRSRGIDLREYVYDMSRVMAAADLMICRAGASTLAELTAMGKPAVLVPSPNVTNNHQEKNARVLEEAGGAVVLPEKDCSAEVLYETVTRLLGDSEKLAEMSVSMRSMGIDDAVERMAAVLIGLASRS